MFKFSIYNEESNAHYLSGSFPPFRPICVENQPIRKILWFAILDGYEKKEFWNRFSFPNGYQTPYPFIYAYPFESISFEYKDHIMSAKIILRRAATTRRPAVWASRITVVWTNIFVDSVSFDYSNLRKTLSKRVITLNVRYGRYEPRTNQTKPQNV